MPVYGLPKFPLVVNIFTGQAGPWAPALPRLTQNAQLYIGSIHAVPFAVAPIGSSVVLKLPKLTDIRDAFGVSGLADFVEYPAGSGRWYLVVYVDDFGKGFANEHRFAVLVKSINKNTGLRWPEPMP